MSDGRKKFCTTIENSTLLKMIILSINKLLTSDLNLMKIIKLKRSFKSTYNLFHVKYLTGWKHKNVKIYTAEFWISYCDKWDMNMI